MARLALWVVFTLALMAVILPSVSTVTEYESVDEKIEEAVEDDASDTDQLLGALENIESAVSELVRWLVLVVSAGMIAVYESIDNLAKALNK